VICKRIVAELGGCIEVDSEEDKYTVFTVKLPIADPLKEADGSDVAGK
jgi:signal transduction histidine kinase